MRRKYETVLEDWKYLFESIGPADDMTGGYVDQHDLDRMLKSPTKKQAIECMIDQMTYWMYIGPDVTLDFRVTIVQNLKVIIKTDKRVAQIKEEYGL